jgi:ABC-type antimicrobial peptide transport system permease subunit
LAYQTVRRHGEIGIRLAFGAARGQIMQLVLKEAALLVLAGLVIGLVGSLELGQAAASTVYGLTVFARVGFTVHCMAHQVHASAAIREVFSHGAVANGDLHCCWDDEKRNAGE